MAFIQGVRLGNIETRDQEHGLTKAYKKTRTVFKAVGSFAKGTVRFAAPLINILVSAGVFSQKTNTLTHVKRGVTLTCVVITIPKIIERSFTGAARASKTKGVELTEEVLKTAAGVSSIALGAMTCFQLSETTIDLLSALSQVTGTGFKVVGEGVSKAVPFIAVFAAIEIVKSLLEAGIEGIKLYKTAKKISVTTKKMNIWSKMDWTDPSYISKKIDRMKVKQIRAVSDLERLEGAVKASSIAFNSHLHKVDYRWAKLQARKIEVADRNPISQLFGQIAPQIKLSAAILAKESAEKKHVGSLKTFDRISTKHTLRAVKIRNFTIVEGKIKKGTLTEQNKVALEYFRKAQLEKLSIKKSNLKVDAVEHSLKIGLKLIVVISLVASLALTFSGVGTMPGIITNASVALFVMVAEYGLKKFRQYSPPKEWVPVRVPVLNKSDVKIERTAISIIESVLPFKDRNEIKVDVSEGKMTLTGSLRDLSELKAIEEQLKSIDNLLEIEIQITQQEPVEEIVDQSRKEEPLDI